MLLKNVINDTEVSVSRVIYRLSDECIKVHPLILLKEDARTSFYTWLRESMNISDDYNMDCTKIHIAKNIQDEWVDCASKAGIDNVSINMTLLNYAPRVDETLSDNEICIYDGFFAKSEKDK